MLEKNEIISNTVHMNPQMVGQQIKTKCSEALKHDKTV